jgi:hypothetical protein
MRIRNPDGTDTYLRKMAHHCQCLSNSKSVFWIRSARYRFDADQDPTFYFDAHPDPDLNPTQIVTPS